MFKVNHTRNPEYDQVEQSPKISFLEEHQNYFYLLYKIIKII